MGDSVSRLEARARPLTGRAAMPMIESSHASTRERVTRAWRRAPSGQTHTRHRPATRPADGLLTGQRFAPRSAPQPRARQSHSHSLHNITASNGTPHRHCITAP